jgi:hypothetical protein
VQRAPENEQRSFEEHGDEADQRSERIGAKSADFIPFGALELFRSEPYADLKRITRVFSSSNGYWVNSLAGVDSFC